MDDGDWDEAYDQDGTVTMALHVTRKVFPDIYVQAVEAIRRGASYAELDQLICAGITECGIPVDNLEWIGYGVPLPAYGVELDDPEFYTTHPDTLPVLACFGISPEPNPFRFGVPDCVYTAARIIADDLQEHTDERYQQIGWLLQWLFSCSGNSSIDFDYETLCECPPLSWGEDEVAFAIAIIQEAEDILSDAMAGLVFLNEHPTLLTTLQHNIQRIYKTLHKRKGTSENLKIRLRW